jgi:MFS family permease
MADVTGRWAGVRLALGRRNYRLFLAGQFVSLIGTWTQSTAQAWLVYRLTGSALWLGIATFCQQAPVLFLATFGGSLADRHRRRNILVVTQSVAMVLAFTLAGLALGGVVRLAHVLILATLLGTVSAVDIPTRQSFVIEMVGRESLMSAVAINSSMVTCASSLGPAIAGFGIEALGEGWCFFANGVSFAAVIAGLLAMRSLPEPTAGRPGESLFKRAGEGFRFVASDGRLRALFGLLALAALAGLPYGTLMPVFAAGVFHGDARALGLMMGAPGLGALLGALSLASRRDVRGTYRWVGVACGAMGMGLVAFSLSRTLWLSIATLVPLGAATMIQVSATNTLVQGIAPDELRGRVMAIWAMILMGFAPLGSVLAGSLATAFGPTTPLLLGGVLCVFAALQFMRWVQRAQPA